MSLASSVEIRNAPVTGVTNYGRVWRKGAGKRRLEYCGCRDAPGTKVPERAETDFFFFNTCTLAVVFFSGLRVLTCGRLLRAVLLSQAVGLTGLGFVALVDGPSLPLWSRSWSGPPTGTASRPCYRSSLSFGDQT